MDNISKKNTFNSISPLIICLVMVAVSGVCIWTDSMELSDHYVSSLVGKSEMHVVLTGLNDLVLFLPILMILIRGVVGIISYFNKSLDEWSSVFVLIDIIASVLAVYRGEVRGIISLLNGRQDFVSLGLVFIQLLCLCNIIINKKRFKKIRNITINSKWKVLFISLSSVVLFFLIILAMSLTGVVNRSQTFSGNVNSGIGANENEYLLDFEAEDISGNLYTADLFKNQQITMINIWGTFCGPCIEEMPNLEIISNEYNQDEFKIVGIIGDIYIYGNYDELQMELAKKIIHETKVTYPSLIPTSGFQEKYINDIIAYPTTIFVNSEGLIVTKVEGAKSIEKWRDIINGVIENEKGND